MLLLSNPSLKNVFIWMGLMVGILIPIAQKAFLAYWSRQYELYPTDSVPVAKCGVLPPVALSH